MLLLVLAATLVLLGLASGVAIGLAILAFHFRQRYLEANRERMLLLNKAFVRDGQATLFPSAIVNEGLEVEESKPKTGRMRSPFAGGLISKRQELADKPRVDAGQKLPDGIKNQIVEAAEKAKAA